MNGWMKRFGMNGAEGDDEGKARGRSLFGGKGKLAGVEGREEGRGYITHKWMGLDF
jgi:hypothetical protein